ncbi:Crp/Fnr family transcriptional regulator [Methylobacterium sp. M6A4_1b]
MPQHLIRKLEQFTRLSGSDKQALDNAASKQCRFGPRSDIIVEGDNPYYVNLILEGWACRYKQLGDGRRQIISLFVPGDLCDEHVYILREMDHSIASLSPVKLAQVPRAMLEGLTETHPRIAKALWWNTLVTAAIQREWTVSLGQRSALERLGHLLCELFWRLRGVGLTEGNACVLPMTQLDLSECLGLSNVHTNRSLQALRKAGLVVLKGKDLTIPDLEALQVASLFNPNYLHVDHEGCSFDTNETTSH